MQFATFSYIFHCHKVTVDLKTALSDNLRIIFQLQENIQKSLMSQRIMLLDRNECIQEKVERESVWRLEKL